MTTYTIVKESKALPEGWVVGNEIVSGSYGVSHKNPLAANYNGRTLYSISQEHLTALLELGIVEEVKEWNARELKRGDRYWFLEVRPFDSQIYCYDTPFRGYDGEKFLIATGNCHPTKAAAENWRDEMLKKYEHGKTN